MESGGGADGRLARKTVKAYTRTLLEELPSLCGTKLEDWCSYLIILFSKVKTTVDALCAENPALRENLEDFMKSNISEANHILRQCGHGMKI